MGGDERDPPFFFQKPTDAIVANGAQVPYPMLTEDFQHEVELAAATSSCPSMARSASKATWAR